MRGDGSANFDLDQLGGSGRLGGGLSRGLRGFGCRGGGFGRRGGGGFSGTGRKGEGQDQGEDKGK